jgi:hypothetical protein
MHSPRNIVSPSTPKCDEKTAFSWFKRLQRGAPLQHRDGRSRRSEAGRQLPKRSTSAPEPGHVFAAGVKLARADTLGSSPRGRFRRLRSNPFARTGGSGRIDWSASNRTFKDHSSESIILIASDGIKTRGGRGGFCLHVTRLHGRGATAQANGRRQKNICSDSF